jgi:SAM-dependent methyltransferase
MRLYVACESGDLWHSAQPGASLAYPVLAWFRSRQPRGHHCRRLNYLLLVSIVTMVREDLRDHPSAAQARISAGKTVLDLGSGGGIDVLLSAGRVEPTGRAYGLDMTKMLARPRENQRKGGLDNVAFLKGELENMPLPNNSADVIISNDQISPATRIAFCVRRSARSSRVAGSRMSDVITRGEVPQQIRQDIPLWVQCIAGGLRDYGVAALQSRKDVTPLRTHRTHRTDTHFTSWRSSSPSIALVLVIVIAQCSPAYFTPTKNATAARAAITTAKVTWAIPELASPERMPMPITGRELPA